MGISFGSINTGLPPNIVQQLVDAERVPIKAIETRKTKAQEQLKLVDDLTGKMREISGGLRELGNTKGFADIKLASGDQSIIAGTADKNIAKPGSYQVEVMQLARKTSAVSNGFPDKDKTQVGVGYFKFQGGDGESKEFYIDNKNNTLENLAKVINSKQLGVQASVLQDKADKENPFKIMLTGKNVGEEGKVEFPTFYFLDGDQDFYLDYERPAENGKVKVDGYEFEISENKLDGVIPGVSLELRQAVPGKEVNISISEDREVIVGKVKTFVERMNAVLQFVQSQNAVDDKTDTTKTLGGDSMLRNIESRLRNVLQNPKYGVAGDIKNLSEIGISFNRSGTLQFDEEKFNGLVASKLQDVSAFFVGDNDKVGLIPEIKNTIAQMLDGVSGPLTQKSKGLRDKINQFDQQIANKERILSQRESQLKNQFSRLEETMSKLKSQGQFLAAKLGGGGGSGGGGLGGLTQG